MTETNKKLQQLIDEAYEAFWMGDDMDKFNELSAKADMVAVDAQKEGGYYVKVYEKNNAGSWTEQYFTGMKAGPCTTRYKVFFETEEEAKEAINEKNKRYKILVESKDMQISVERA